MKFKKQVAPLQNFAQGSRFETGRCRSHQARCESDESYERHVQWRHAYNAWWIDNDPHKSDQKTKENNTKHVGSSIKPDANQINSAMGPMDTDDMPAVTTNGPGMSDHKSKGNCPRNSSILIDLCNSDDPLNVGYTDKHFGSRIKGLIFWRRQCQIYFLECMVSF